MKKTRKTAMIAAAFAAVSLASCGGGSSSSNTPAAEISAPETTASQTTASESAESETFSAEVSAAESFAGDTTLPLIQTEYGPPEVYDPSSEEPQEVYGPPQDLSITGEYDNDISYSSDIIVSSNSRTVVLEVGDKAPSTAYGSPVNYDRDPAQTDDTQADK